MAFILLSVMSLVLYYKFKVYMMNIEVKSFLFVKDVF